MGADFFAFAGAARSCSVSDSGAEDKGDSSELSIVASLVPGALGGTPLVFVNTGDWFGYVYRVVVSWTLTILGVL